MDKRLERLQEILQEQAEEIKALASEIPTDADCLGCNCPKMEMMTAKWIPCSERLPEIHRSEYVPHPYLVQTNLLEDYYMISEPVLVTRINPSIKPEERIVVAQYEDDLDGRTYWETLDAELLVGVVAWQPLPEPYREAE